MTESVHLLIVSAALAAAGVVKGATGIGYATCALPVLVQLLGLKPAMALVIAPTIAANVGAVMSSGPIAPTLKAYAPLYVAMLPGIVIGLLGLSWIEPKAAVAILGTLMVAYSTFALTKPRLSLPEALARNLRIPVGLACGAAAGLTGAQVVPLVPYMLALPSDHRQILKGINIGVLVLSAALGVGLVVSHDLGSISIGACLIAVLPAMLGTWLGVNLQARLNGSTAQTLVLVMVGLMGLKMALL